MGFASGVFCIKFPCVLAQGLRHCSKGSAGKACPLCPLLEGVFNASPRGSSNRVFSRFDRFHTDLCGTVDSYAKVLGAAGQMRRIGACHQGFGRAKKLAFNNHDFLTSATSLRAIDGPGCPVPITMES